MRRTRDLLEGAALVTREMTAAHGAEFPWHTASLESVLVVTEGTAAFEFPDEAHVLGAGDSFIVPADIPHRVVGSPGFTAVHVMPKEIRFDFRV